MRKIKSVTVISGGDNVSTYTVGETVNGITISEIRDDSLEYPDSFHSKYVGRDKSNYAVFIIVDCPVAVHYYEEK